MSLTCNASLKQILSCAPACRIAGAGKGFSDPVENLRELQRFCQIMCFSNLCVKQSTCHLQFFNKLYRTYRTFCIHTVYRTYVCAPPGITFFLFLAEMIYLYSDRGIKSSQEKVTTFAKSACIVPVLPSRSLLRFILGPGSGRAGAVRFVMQWMVPCIR